MQDQTLHDLLRQRGQTLASVAMAAGVDKATVTRWGQKRIPAERVLQVERITGIPRHVLRPDIYPNDLPASDGEAA